MDSAFVLRDLCAVILRFRVIILPRPQNQYSDDYDVVCHTLDFSSSTTTTQPGSAKKGVKEDLMPEHKPAEFKPVEKEDFNPQPEPPGLFDGLWNFLGFSGGEGQEKPGEKEGFNPQPEPPGLLDGILGFLGL